MGERVFVKCRKYKDGKAKEIGLKQTLISYIFTKYFSGWHRGK